MKGFFEDSSQDLPPEKVKKTRAPKRSVPKKNTAPSGSSGKGPLPNLPCQTAQFHPPFSSQGTFQPQLPGEKGPAQLDVLDKNALLMKLAMPPRQSSEDFLEAYEVVLVLDDRENFGSHSRKVAQRKVADQIYSEFKVPVENCGLRKLIYLVEDLKVIQTLQMDQWQASKQRALPLRFSKGLMFC